jgi:glutamate/tyrosine decarboxylase-like PLP-dependent enzyme/putative intracellular protease/amidase
MRRNNIGIFVFDDIELLDFTGPFGVFARARLVVEEDSGGGGDGAPFNVFLVARSKKAISVIGGLQILPQYAWRSAPPIDILVIPGGFGTRKLLEDGLAIDWVRSAASKASLVTSVGTGALLLAKAGLLRGRRATTHLAECDLLTTLDPTIVVERRVRVVHDSIITSAGISAGIEMALDVVELRCGPDVAAKTADYLESRPHDFDPAREHVRAGPSDKWAIGFDSSRAAAPVVGGSVIQPLILARAAWHAGQYLSTINERHVGALASGNDLRHLLGCPLSEEGEDGRQVVDELARAGQRGTTASQGPRYFGFVTGGSFPVATAADWLVSAWDQNGQVYVMSPIASVVEEIAAGWLKDLLGLPATWSVGFVTGAQMASFTSLVVARHRILREVDWDVERDGLFGAPNIDVVVSDESHRTIFTALRMLGLGGGRLHRVKTDGQGRMRTDHLSEILQAGSGPCIVCAQVGNVNTGACDPIAEIALLARRRGAWLHVDGAIGMWAAASPSLRHLVAGVEQADSIAADGHKWLNVPYDSGIVLTAHPESHQRALMMPAHYIQMTKGERDSRAFTPDESRRARGVTVYATLRTLGRRGVRELIERCCAHARRMAEALQQHSQVRVQNDVVLNQVLVQFVPLPGDARDEGLFTEQVVEGIQRDGTCWLGSTEWHGQRAARISVCNWSTTQQDIDRSAAVILRTIEQSNVHA